jgi:hypothetical protein
MQRIGSSGTPSRAEGQRVARSILGFYTQWVLHSQAFGESCIRAEVPAPHDHEVMCIRADRSSSFVVGILTFFGLMRRCS